MEALLLLLAFPLAWPFVAKRIWHTTINWTEMVIQIFAVGLIVTGVWYAGVYGQMTDTEIWNGKLTKKEMNDGHYTTSYDCNCTTDSNGNRSCQTCYEDHYTRSYDGYTTVGNFTFDSIDTTSRMRRNAFSPPSSYNAARIGEPASREHTYTNYVQAVPESLFHDDGTTDAYADQIPSYPRVYGFYKIGRVLQVGTSYQYSGNLNTALNEALIDLGARKQVNIVVILTEIDDPSYRYSVERAWLGGEKNDVIVIIGLDGETITWSDTITWALNKGNELFNVKMRDGVEALGTLDYKTLVPFITSTIDSTYDRPEMKDFEYLKDAIDPPGWVIIMAVVIAIGGSLGLSFFFHVVEVRDIIGELFGGRRTRRYYR